MTKYYKYIFRNGDGTTARNHTHRTRASVFWTSWNKILVIIGIGVIALIVAITIANNHSNMTVLVILFIRLISFYNFFIINYSY